MLAHLAALCIANVRQEGHAGSMLLLYIDEPMIYDILRTAARQKAPISHGVVWSRSPRNEMKLINHPRFYWLAACVRASGPLTWLMARLEADPRAHAAVREACPQISMSSGPLFSARYWLAALGSLRVSTSQAGEEDECGGGGCQEINLAQGRGMRAF